MKIANFVRKKQSDQAIAEMLEAFEQTEEYEKFQDISNVGVIVISSEYIVPYIEIREYGGQYIIILGRAYDIFHSIGDNQSVKPRNLSLYRSIGAENEMFTKNFGNVKVVYFLDNQIYTLWRDNVYGKFANAMKLATKKSNDKSNQEPSE